MGFQLTLGIKLSTKSTLENFVRGANEELLNSLEGLLAGRESTWIHLWGPEGSGKTHLLQASCHRLVYQGQQAAYIDFAHLTSLEVLTGLHQLKLVAFDDVFFEEHSPDVLNGFAEFVKKAFSHHHLMMTASEHKLPETLTKQFTHIREVHLEALSEQNMAIALKKKAQERGLLLPQEVQTMLIQCSEGSMKRLNYLLDRLEQSCDLLKKKVTSSFFKNLLKQEADQKI